MVLEYLALTAIVVALMGWLFPLLVGLLRLISRRAGGRKLTAVGGAWLVLATCGMWYYSYVVVPRDRAAHDLRADNRYILFTSETSHGETGTVVTSYKGEGVIALGPFWPYEKGLLCTSKDGVFRVPAGKLMVERYECVGRDSSGGEWLALVNLPLQPIDHSNRRRETVQVKTIDVPANSITELDLAPPAKASVKVLASDGETISLSLSLTDSAGRGYDIGRVKGGLPKLGFVCLSKSDEELWQGSLSYG